ncbi:PEP-CTERM sorting domain-containing protein [Horticoccus luteus]|uniref:PEP-CTERM sorting domain-containing protein n=1 Tax=Horticoccus luteus TaxID=2862869 RepID=A0A8F9TVN3_9BACT|nr:PEP-CTERM sorting domain-containing protein [Horticoccus luteus]QYM80099.1 PEP-CTERM sorting domain-containing protein [Horticoccus luteus]
MITPRVTLLQSAKAFIAKSAKVAAVIAPLAVAVLPTEAEAQVTFGPVTSTSASALLPSGGGGVTNYTASSWFTKSASPETGFAGQQFGANYIITDLPETGYGLMATIGFQASSGSSGSLATDGAHVPFAYQFSLTSSPGIANASWWIDVTLLGEGGYNTTITAASGFFDAETFSGVSDLVTTPEWGDGPSSFALSPAGYSVQLHLQFSAIAPTDSISVSMGNSEGFALGSSSLTAVPEPSTYALLVGALVMGYAAYRRRRAA